MGGLITIGISGVASYLFYSVDHTILMVLAIVNTLISFWSRGIMHNYASYAMREKAEILRNNLEAEGRLDSEAEERISKLEHQTLPEAIPNWIAMVNLLSFIGGIALLITYFVFIK